MIGAGLAGLACALRIADDGGARVGDLAPAPDRSSSAALRSTCSAMTPDRVDRPLDASGSLDATHPVPPSSAPSGWRQPSAWLRERLPALELRGDGEREPAAGHRRRRRPPDGSRPGVGGRRRPARGGPVVFVGFPSLKDFVPELVAANVARAERAGRRSVETRAVDDRDARRQRGRHLAARPRPRLRRPRAARRSGRGGRAGGRRRPTAPAWGCPAVLGANYHPEAYAASLRGARRRGVRGTDHSAVGARASGSTGP